jgi:hypothetical protein
MITVPAPGPDRVPEGGMLCRLTQILSPGSRESR